VGPEGFKGRIRLSKSGYRSHDGYMAAMPIVAGNDDVTLGIEEEKDLLMLLPAFGGIKPDAAKGIVDPFILDCDFRWLAPVIVEIDRPYEKRYYLDKGPALKDGVPASIEGQLSGALFVNVEPGPVVATFRSYASGTVIGSARGVVSAGHWTALPAFPN
jgi:hypothetical protein